MENNKQLRSFGRLKSRKLRENPQRLMDEVLPKITYKELPTGKDIWLEIGFGGGEHLAHQAKNNPNVNIIGFEPFINGTAKLLREVEDNKLTNVLVHNGDARDVLEKLPDNVISKVYILFPDPWPKRKHNKRRLIQKPLLDMLYKAIKPGGELLIATDHEGYAQWILHEIFSHNVFEWQAKCKADWQNEFPGHIKTKYQLKNMAKTVRPLFLRFLKP
jgi:tRNA (guanine-N7-)-methyltransferase